MSSEQSIFSLALTFFIIANPLGNSPAIAALIKDFPFERQKKIMLREAMIAIPIAFFFQFIGESFLDLIQVKSYALGLCGGVLLFFVALEMIFPKTQTEEIKALKQEPFVFPIASPLISGPGLMTIIMVFSKQVDNCVLISSAIALCFAAVTVVLLSAPYLQKVLGKKGLLALEKLMGLLVCMIAIEMMLGGFGRFIQS